MEEDSMPLGAQGYDSVDLVPIFLFFCDSGFAAAVAVALVDLVALTRGGGATSFGAASVDSTTAILEAPIVSVVPSSEVVSFFFLAATLAASLASTLFRVSVR